MNIYIMYFLALLASSSVALCPIKCVCNEDRFNRKQMVCDEGGLTDLAPLLRMDDKKDEEIIRVTAPDDNQNFLEIGPIFQVYRNLKELHITMSNVPAIGKQTFLRMVQLRVLNLSQNNIKQLWIYNFQGMVDLEELYLEENDIESIPSATFQYLRNLRTLSLARNNLNELSPRMYMELTLLEVLDLSGNPLKVLNPRVLKDVRNLKTFRCQNCSLTVVNQSSSRLEDGKEETLTMFGVLSQLEELDLRDNYISFLEPDQFVELPRLRVLRLDGNLIKTVPGRAFVDHSFYVLSLSRNRIRDFSSYAFYGITTRELDLSFNYLDKIDGQVLRAIAPDIRDLKIGGNILYPDNLQEVLRPMKKLTSLSMVGMRLTQLDPAMVEFMVNLKSLNMSDNHLSDIPLSFFDNMPNLKILDLSKNSLRGLNFNLLKRFDDLSIVYLHRNPWSCSICYIADLKHWLGENDAFIDSCASPSNPNCLKCVSPYHLAGVEIQNLNSSSMAMCELETAAPNVQLYDSKLGIIIASVVAILLCFIVLIIILMYNRHTAHYRTHEEKRKAGDGLYQNGFTKISNGEKKAAIATIDELTKDELYYKDDTSDLIVKLDHSPKLNGRTHPT